MCERERDGGQGRDDHCVTRAQYIYWDSKLLKVLFTHRYTWQHFWFKSDEEQRFMYKINQGHLTTYCIVFV